MEFNIVTGSDDQGYDSGVQLYTKRSEDYSASELKKLSLVLLAQIPTRIKSLSNYIYAHRGVRITPESPDEVLDRLPNLIASLGGMREPSPEEIDLALSNARPQAEQMLRHFFSAMRFEDQTAEMVFDAGLLWGEAFRARFPLAQWTMGRPPKSSIYYGAPVLIGKDRFKSEFHPGGQLSGMVYSLLENKPEGRSLSRRNARQAVDLMLQPNRVPKS